MKMAVLIAAALILTPLPTRSQEAQRTENRERSAARGVQQARPSRFPEFSPGPQVVDVTALPSIDSLTADTDIRAFLQPGVPAELTTAALRRAWTIDPAIRDFIEVAENQGDLTDPTGIPGFGPLEDTDEIGRLVAQAHGQTWANHEVP